MFLVYFSISEFTESCGNGTAFCCCLRSLSRFLQASANSLLTFLISFFLLSFSLRSKLHSSISLVFWFRIALMLSSRILFSFFDVSFIRYSFFVSHFPYFINSSPTSSCFSAPVELASVLSTICIYWLFWSWGSILRSFSSSIRSYSFYPTKVTFSLELTKDANS